MTAPPTDSAATAPVTTAIYEPAAGFFLRWRQGLPGEQRRAAEGPAGEAGQRRVPDSTFTKIVCFRGYAATTVPERSDSDESYVVCKHAAGAWSVLSSGTAGICPGVPDDVVRHFRAARYGACGQG